MEPTTFKPPRIRRLGLRRIILLFIFFAFGSCTMTDGEVYYIPEGYTGNIIVLFECEDGLPREWKNGKRLYRIPPSGVLKTQFKVNTGHLFFKATKSEDERTKEKHKAYNKKFEFYYVDKNGKPIKRLNYPIYTYSKEFIKPNDYNVFGSQGISGFGNNNQHFTTKNVIFYKDSTDLNFIDYFEDKNPKKNYKIYYWDTFDARKDSIPADFNPEKFEKRK